MGVRDAFEEGQICAQKDTMLQVFRGDEDCLYLNVYTPKVR
jgi:carboxylesterase type B